MIIFILIVNPATDVNYAITERYLLNTIGIKEAVLRVSKNITFAEN